MSNKLPRRTFLMGWLGGLLAGWLGRSHAQATSTPSPSPATPPPSHAQRLRYAAFGPTVTLTAYASDWPEQSFSWQVSSPSGSAPLSYSCSDLPPGLSIDPATGLISGTISCKSA